MLSDPVRKRFRQLHTAARHNPIDDSVDDEKIIITNRHCDRFGDAVTLFLRKMMSTRPPFGSVYGAAVVAGYRWNLDGRRREQIFLCQQYRDNRRAMTYPL